jgi:VWFA-related protein
MKRTALALSLFLLTAVTAHAQYGETVEVRVTNVDAIVVDKAGKPVPGLTRDDFEVYEDGARQDLTNFAEIAETPGQSEGGVAPAGDVPLAGAVRGDIRRRVITVFIDHGSLEPTNLVALLPELQQFLTSNLRPGDAAVIYSWGDSLILNLAPTGNREAIAAAIASLRDWKPKRINWWRGVLEVAIRDAVYVMRIHYFPPPAIGEGIALAQKAADQGLTEMRQKAEALKSVIASLKPVEGRKVLVVLTQSMSTNPAEEAFYYLWTQRGQFKDAATYRWEDYVRRYPNPGFAADVAAAANNAGVTLYPIHTAGKFTDQSVIDVGGFHQKLDAGGIQRDPRRVTLAIASDVTGGRAIAGSGNWKGALDIVANELNAYYSLGYRSTGVLEDRTRNIEVRLKNKAYTVRTRKTIVEQTAATAMKALVAANLFQEAAANDLAVRASVGSATPAGENLVHPLTVTIPTSGLTLVPDGTDLVGKLSIFTSFLRSDGAVSPVGRQMQQFRFPASSLAKRKEVTVKLDVTAEASVGAISLGVMDDVSNATGFALLKLPGGSTP